MPNTLFHHTMKNLLILLSIFSFADAKLVAQKITFPPELEITANKIFPIVSDKEVIGYYSYSLEYTPNNSSKYKLIMMNNNFEVSRKVDYEIKDSWTHDGLVFNGSVFCIVTRPIYLFKVRYDFVDLEGDHKGTIVVDKFEKKQFYYNLSDFLEPVANKGFLKFGPDTDGEDQVVEFINNDGKVQYRIKPKEIPQSKGNPELERLNFAFHNDSLLVLSARAENPDQRKLGNRTDKDLRIYSLQDGKEIKLIHSMHKEGRLIPFDIAKRKDGFTIYGKYFEKEDTQLGYNDEGVKGLYMQRYGTDGNLHQEVFQPIQNNLDKLSDSKGEIMKEDIPLWFHAVLEVQDGRSFAICESYDQYEDGRKNSYSIFVGDFIVLEFDNNFSAPKVHRFPKQRWERSLMYATFPNIYKAGDYAEDHNLFDYQFASMNTGHSVFTGIYTSYDHARKRPDEKYTLGAIAFNIDGELINPKITLDNFPKNVAFIPAKTGYTALLELNEEQKSVSLTMYKFDL